MKARLMRHKPLLLFLAIYTAVFWLSVAAAGYVMPVITALIISVVMRPLYDHLRRRFFFNSAFAATSITLLVYGAVLAVLGYLLYLIAVQAVSLVQTYGYLIKEHLSPPELFDSVREALMTGDLFNAASGVAEVVFRTVPLVITFIIFTFVLTIFFLNHLRGIKAAILDRVSQSRREIVGRVLSTGYGVVRRFIRSYMILYFITFVEAVFIFWLTGAPYPLAFGFITAVADILPVLGPGTVYIPFSIFFFLQENYIAGVTLLVFFLLTSVLRQILEPKIVSDTVKVHPLAVMAAIYFSIVAMNLWILFYVILLFMTYKVLVISGVLPPLNEKPPKS